MRGEGQLHGDIFGAPTYNMNHMDPLIYIGLGNPGDQYEGTRHNFGIAALREWVTTLPSESVVESWHLDTQRQAEIAKVIVGERNVICLFPHTFMNESGKAVSASLNYFKLGPENLVVVHDDLELPFGTVEEKVGGGTRGHKGLRSIVQALGTNAWRRISLGVGRPQPGTQVSAFVLQKFSEMEQTELADIQQRAIHLLSTIAANAT